MNRYDVVVVGGRVAGASTALLLARAGARVALIDRSRPGCCNYPAGACSTRSSRPAPRPSAAPPSTTPTGQAWTWRSGLAPASPLCTRLAATYSTGCGSTPLTRPGCT